MTDEPKQRGLSEKKKAECRREFEVGGSKIAPLARKYAIARNTLKSYIKDECWSRSDQAIEQMVKSSAPVDDAVIAAAKSNVIDFAKRRAVEMAQADGTIERLARSAKSNLDRMAAIEAGALEEAELTIKRLRGDAGTVPLRGSAMASEAADIKAGLDAAARAVDLFGKLHGLGTGDSFLGTEEEDDGRLTVIEQVITPIKVDVDQNGRALVSESA